MEILTTIGIFAGLQTANVILQTLRQLAIAKISCPHKNAALNAVAFGFYVVIVQQIANVPLVISVPLTVITNVVGIYITFAIFRKWQKDELWKIEIYSPCQIALQGITQALHQAEIQLRQDTPQVITVYSYSQADSVKIKMAIQAQADSRIKHNVTKVARL